MGLRWNDNLSTGVSEIDAQHRALFGHINALLEACRGGHAMEQIPSLLAFLQEYVESHFAMEEELMVSSGYPLLPSHRRQHEGFLQGYSVLKEEALTSQGLSLTLSANRLLTDWWINHISGSDRELGDFLRDAPYRQT